MNQPENIRFDIGTTDINHNTIFSECLKCGGWYYGFHSCQLTYQQVQFPTPTAQADLKWLVCEVSRLSREVGRLQALLEGKEK